MTTAHVGISTAPAHDCPVVNLGDLFPRHHPSAKLALGFGVASLVGLGPIAGLPAILLSALVRRELDASKGLVTGAGLAKAAYVTGWVGTLVYGLVYGYALSFAWVTGAFIVGGLGLALALVWLMARRDHAILRWLVPAAGLALVASSVVASLHRRAVDAAELERRQAACASLMADGEAALEAERYVVARDTFDEAKGVCPSGDELERAERLSTEASETERARLLAETEARRIREQQARAAEEKRRAQEKAERDRQAVEDFETEHSDLAKRAKKAARSAKRGDLDASRKELDDIGSALESFADSPVTADPRWETVVEEVASARSVLDEQTEKAIKAREARETRQAAVAERKRQRESKKKRRSYSSNRVRCCDGSLSPSCTYGRSLRGCCSHHGGVC